jgi:RNA polymerase sigma factor (sigma-70 family)
VSHLDYDGSPATVSPEPSNAVLAQLAGIRNAAEERSFALQGETGPFLPQPGGSVRETPAGFAVEDRELLYADFAPLVRRLIRQYGNDDPELKQDLAGEIYYRFCLLVDTYDPTRGVPLRPYLVRQLTASVYTFARQQWRSRKREVSLDSTLSDGGAGLIGQVSGRNSNGSRTPFVTGAHGVAPQFAVAADPTPAWDEEIVREKLLKCLPTLIAGLPKRQKQVVIWRYYEQRSFEEIAALLKVKPATARSLLRHGLANLRKELADGEIPSESR